MNLPVPRLRNRGFTMIELLVVMAVLALLAIAVLSALNPIEQINKGRDTQLRSSASELLNATERFYAVHEMYPWNRDSADGSTYVAGARDASTDPDQVDVEAEFNGATAGSFAWVEVLKDVAEVKDAFTNRFLDNEADYYLYKDDDSDTTYVCFDPSSKQFQTEAADRCALGAAGSDDGLMSDADAHNIVCATDAEMICIP